MTTWELDKLIYEFIIKHGGTPNFKGLYGFPGNGLHQPERHRHPRHPLPRHRHPPGRHRQHRHRRQGGRLQRDNACTYPVGKIDLEAQRLLDVTKEALHLGIAQAKAGNRIGDISQAVQTYCEEAGFSVVREFVGHGTGRELHEAPRCPTLATPAAAPAWCPA